MVDSAALARQVGAKIRFIRTSRRMSLEKLALECDMNATFLGHVERGLRCPTVQTLQRICTGLGITLAELFLTETVAAPNAAAIQHVSAAVSSLTPDQAAHVCDLVDAALALLPQE